MAYRNKKILLIDDSPSDVELTVHAVKQAQLATSIAVAEDGQQALDYLFCRGVHESGDPADRPSVILLDLNLTKVDRLQVLETLRADERARAIPIVILTFSKETDGVVAGYRLGSRRLPRSGRLETSLCPRKLSRRKDRDVDSRQTATIAPLPADKTFQE